MRDGFAARSLDFGDHVGGGPRSITSRAVAAHARIIDDDRGALCGQRQAMGAPDASTAAGDQNNAPGKWLIH
ncbi:hypothetical protein MAHJHV65_19440 [Mycobacterium avium subsp. hominissuis]